MPSMFSKFFRNKDNTPKQNPTEPMRPSFDGPDEYERLNRSGPRPTQYFQEQETITYRQKPSKPMDLSSLFPVAPQHKINVSSSQQKINQDEQDIKDLVDGLKITQSAIVSISIPKNPTQKYAYATALQNRTIYLNKLNELNKKHINDNSNETYIRGRNTHKAFMNILKEETSNLRGGKRKTHRKHKTRKTMRSKSHKTNKNRTTRRR